MSIGEFLVGLLCFLGIVSYWYFLPYQFWLRLVGAGSLWGPILGNLIMFLITTLIGIPLTVFLGVVGLAMWLGESL